MPVRWFEWEQLLDVAEDLAQRIEEPYLRTAIGRAYYYVFHLARRRLLANSFYFSLGGDSHRQVWEKFSGSPDNQCKLLALTANFLKERRIKADYEANYARIEEDIPLVIEKAKKFAAQLAQLNPQLPRNTGIKP